MKQCSNCKKFYQDDDDFCPEDGSPLGASGNAENRVVVSWDERPTEPAPRPFVPPPLPHPVPQQGGGNNAILYALIGALVAVVVIGGIYILNSGPDKTTWSNTSSASTPGANQSPAVKPANTATPLQNKIPVATNTNSSGSSAKLDRSFRGTFDGTLDGHSIQMQIERDGRSLGGKVTPTRRDAAEIYLDGTIEDDGSFVMDEKSDTGVVTGIYRGRIDADGGMSGTWTKPNGDRACSFSLRKQ